MRRSLFIVKLFVEEFVNIDRIVCDSWKVIVEPFVEFDTNYFCGSLM